MLTRIVFTDQSDSTIFRTERSNRIEARTILQEPFTSRTSQVRQSDVEVTVSRNFWTKQDRSGDTMQTQLRASHSENQQNQLIYSTASLLFLHLLLLFGFRCIFL